MIADPTGAPMIPRLVPALVAVLLLAPPVARAAAPWEGAPFSATPRALLDAAAALPGSAAGGVDVLLEEATFSLDARGAAVFTHRLVYRVLSETGARTWGEVQRGWAPWYQARPQVEARVVTADGAAHRLDPTALAERDAGPQTARRRLGGPLPGISAGAIVEEVAVIRDLAPMFAAGGSTRIFLAQPVPVRALRLVVEAPEALPLRVAVSAGIPAPRETVRRGIRQLEIERRDVPPFTHPEPLAPREVAVGPSATIGWARSWSEVAAGYAALCERALADQDLAGLVRAALGAEAPRGRDAAVRAVAAYLRDGVRASGRALGEDDLAPASPGETFVRRGGDGKDLAVLAVALLRGLGVDADPVLVRGSWNELDPAVPGVGVFEHVIVRVAGTPELWLDPSEPGLAPGRLPAQLEGRLALVASPGTRGLARTPEAPPEANRIRTVRELRLASLGRGRVLEVRELEGALAAPERLVLRGADAEGRVALGERYAKDAFGSADLVLFDVEGQDDPARPLRVRTEAREAEVVRTDDDLAEVPVTPDQVFGALPSPLGPGEPRPPRSADAVLELPYVWEIVYRIVPPDGFRARPLPGPVTEAFGPARYSASAALEPDGAVAVRYRFDTGARRLAAADADRLARRVREISAGRGPTVAFERIAAALLAEGKAAEAVAELRRLQAAHPADALHRLHLSLALLSLGFGDAAVAEARRAVALEPDRAWCHRVLGFALEHDGLGRQHGPGYDHAGALAAYRTALRLDPDLAAGRAALAELLAHAPDGTRHGKGARLDAAIAEYRVIREDLGERGFVVGELAALLAAGRVAEAETVARDTPPGPERDAALVAAVAAQRGAAAGVAEADGLGGGRGHALQAASRILLRSRRYELVHALAAAAGRDAEEARRLTAPFERVQRWDTLRAGDEATRLVRRLLVASATAREPAAAVKPLVARHALLPELRAPAIAAAAGVAAGAPASARDEGVPLDVLLDVILSKLEIERDGDPATGLRLRIRFAQGGPGAAIYAVREGGALRVLGTSAAFPLAAARALRLADAGDLGAARRWLGWARDAAAGEPDDPASPAGIAAALLPAGGPPDRARVRVAAAALLAFADTKGRTLATLARARAGAAPPARRALGFALAQAQRAAGRNADLLPLARALREEAPSRTAFGLEIFAAEKLGRPDLLDGIEAALATALPDDAEARALVPNARLALVDLAGARRGFRTIVDTGKKSPGLLNNAAWLELWFDDPAPALLEWARGANPEGTRAHAALNTLAAVLASTGHPQEARETLRRSLEANGEVAPVPADWFVVGRIAEALGLPEVARAAYLKVKPEPEDPTSPFLLARRRLERLGPAPAAVPLPPPARRPAAPAPEPKEPPRKPGRPGRRVPV
jgi:tetratricopeptide (TPR) repeat protein